MKKLFLIFILVVFTACSENSDSPEKQVKTVITSIEQGIEKRSLSQVTDHIDDNYLDHKGRTKQDIKRYLQLHILRNQNITILSRIKSFEFSENTASIELSAASAARGTDLSIDANRLKADTHNASIVLNNSSGSWKIISASWGVGL